MFVELLIVEKDFKQPRTYRLEDFFWTGSGDGALSESDEHPWITEPPLTVYKTTTVLSTVYLEGPSTYVNQVSVTKGKTSLTCTYIDFMGKYLS